MDDPYVTLGIAKTATADEIKKAYRKLIKVSHPDLNPDDPGAEQRFKSISAAYDILKDPATRARFDAGEIDASGAERPERRYYRDFAEGQPYQRQSGFEAGIDPADIFAEILRGRGGKGFAGFDTTGLNAAGQDVHYTLEVPFLDAVRGARTRITLPDGGVLEVQIPQGTSDGRTLRLRGKGGPGLGKGAPGDAYVTLTVRPHPQFRREGDNIHLDLPISLDEAVLGGKVEVPTIEGTVSLTIPKGVSSGRVLRLRGRGVKGGSGHLGDQLVELRIVLPPKVDDALAAFLQDWRKSNHHDPRTGVFKGEG